MPLSAGTRIGPYSVTAKIGQGGMGEVYQARDTSLDRDVALKVLPEGFTSDPERSARFEREAKLLASLNHPNIGHIYGLEELDGAKALVLELVDGPTLADRIAQGPIPSDEALAMAEQIAAALEAAHEQGTIHRDLKPANVKVKLDGTVKVLDFGLAKALEPTPDGDSSESPTMTAAATREGVILGTAAYMSPEQASGAHVDHRADIWSFGVVLFEMLTGRRLFEGETVSHVLAAVLKTEPNWETLPAATPARMTQVLRTCLRKRPKQRMQAIGDVRLAMEGAFETTGPTGPKSGRPSVAWMVAAGMLGALVAVGASWSLIPGDEPAVAAPFSFEVVLPATIVGDNSRGELAITPDGSRLVYVGPPTGGEAPELYVHQIGQQFDTPLQGSAGGTGPFLSPDGQSIGFVEGGSTIKQMPIGGGAPITLGTLPAGTYGASWTADDGIIVGTFERNDGGLYRLAAGGGEPEPLSTLDAGRNEMGHIWPFAVPDTDVVLFAAMTSAGGQSTELAAFSIDTGDISYLGIPGTSPRYVETGHLLYATVDGTGQVLAVPFDPQTLDVGNSPVPVLEGVNVHATSAAADFDVSNAGHLVAVSRSGVPSRPRTLTWVDRDGREESLTLDAGNYIAVQLSPDESQVALQELRNGTYDILAWHLARENLIRVTTDPGDDINPTWTPDGQHILFTSNRNRLRNVFMKAANGTGDVDQLTQGESQHHVDSTTPDGAIALYYANGTLRSVSLERPFDSETLLDGLEGRTNALPSSDGQWLALQERVSDRAEVFLRPWPNVRGDREPVSQGGGEQVVWSADGDELFYLSEDHLMARPIANGVPTGPEEQLFEVGSYYRGLHHSFDVAADGRFLMISEEDVADGFESEPLVTFDFTLNWFEVLEERVPLP